MSHTIFDQLRADHDKQRRLVDILVKTRGASDGRRELWERLKRELDTHARAEERAFYAPLLEAKQGRGQARHSVHEHVEIDEAIERVDELDFDNPHWLRRFKKLADLIEHHLDEEETEVFPLAGRLLGEQQKRDLAKRMQGAKDQLYHQEEGAAE